MDAKKRARTDRGTALPFMVIAMIPLGMLMAAFMDAARLYVTLAQMQVAADAAALAGASGFIDGDNEGDSIQARVEHYVEANAIGEVPAIVDSLTMNLDSGTLRLVLRHPTGSLLLFPEGMTLRARSQAKAMLAGAGETGRAIPNGNAFGWWRRETADSEVSDTSSGGSESALVKLGS
jgi:putative Flp pilus-assembly TadE/G-like protein